MKEVECIPYSQTGFFSPLILDYLAESPKLKPFIETFPNLKAFEGQIERKSGFSDHQRKLLVKTLRKQYQEGGIELDDSLEERLLSLEAKNTYTVCTGHQLNILTGPLYFIYKIISTINLAERLKEAYPKYSFQPIYWMASEDHDFEEISFINLFGGRLHWQNSINGAVGHMPNYGMGKVLDELEEHLGPGEQAAEILKLFRQGYHEHDNLAQATRYIVHGLFNQYGLLIIDGDDAELKRSMLPYFKKDLFEDDFQVAAQTQSQALKEAYFAQVFPREVNLFYLQPGSRERIEKRGDYWFVLNTDLKFNRAELEAEMDKHPERFSPNVVLRPLYQEVVLPNLAYIGGGGEIAYWLQLKALFDAAEVPFPLPMLRNSVLFIEPKWQNRMADMDLKSSDLFKGLETLKKEFIANHFPEDIQLEKFDRQLEDLFNDLEAIANITDKSMMGAVNAQRQKQLNGIENLRKKLLRAEKRRHSEDMEKLERIYYSLFPKGGLQERHDNLAYYFSAYGWDFISLLKASLNPLDFSFSIIKA